VSDRSKRILRWGGLVAVLAVAFFTLRGKLPDPGSLWTALRTAHLWWIVVAVLAESASMRHFALQQRRLLAGFGVDMSLPRALAITYTRSAMSISLPAGSAVSAGYAFRQFRGVGAGRRVAAAVMVLSGLLSAVALVIMYGLVLLADQIGLPGGGGNAAIGVVVWTTLGIALVLFVVDYYVLRRGCTRTGTPVVEEAELPGGAASGTRRQRLFGSARRTLATLRDLPARAWMGSLAHATVNWATDFACLAATSAAFDLHIGVTRLATVYVTVQLVRQVPISPGGIGVIEVSLLAGLVSAGAARAPAAAAMLVYRLISCWLIIPAGGLAYAALRTSASKAVSTTRTTAPALAADSVAGPAPARVLAPPDNPVPPPEPARR
jgi:uncharacterized membrane protein YbhN (UPF0104 family)